MSLRKSHDYAGLLSKIVESDEFIINFIRLIIHVSRGFAELASWLTAELLRDKMVGCLKT